MLFRSLGADFAREVMGSVQIEISSKLVWEVSCLVHIAFAGVLSELRVVVLSLLFVWGSGFEMMIVGSKCWRIWPSFLFVFFWRERFGFVIVFSGLGFVSVGVVLFGVCDVGAPIKTCVSDCGFSLCLTVLAGVGRRDRVLLLVVFCIWREGGVWGFSALAGGLVSIGSSVVFAE